MVDTLPNGKLVEVEKAAHMVFEDNPDGFLEAVQPFLGLRTPDGGSRRHTISLRWSMSQESTPGSGPEEIAMQIRGVLFLEAA